MSENDNGGSGRRGKTRLELAEELLGCTIDANGFAACPGEDLHSTKGGKRDFRVVLDGAPTGYCFHGSCGNVVQEFNLKLRRAVWFEENGDGTMPGTGSTKWKQVAAEPKATPAARPEIDEYSIWEATRGVPAIDEEWLRRRSAVDVAGVTPGEFLDHIFELGERILIFTSQMSQGDFLWAKDSKAAAEPGKGYRLAQERGVKAKPSELPEGARDGVWYLVQPVSGMWEIAAVQTWEDGQRGTEGKYTRRSQINVTAWRNFVLESDTIDAARWLRVLVSLRFPIVAIYSSGGRSVHAIVRMPVASKAEWDAARNLLKQLVCPLGADPGALSAVRLSRLPGCKRGNKLQKLLYLNPRAGASAIQLLPELRA